MDPKLPKMQHTSSSMIELKAELFRKQEEYNQKKVSISQVKDNEYIKNLNREVHKKRNSSVSKRGLDESKSGQADLKENLQEDVDAKSRKALEAKARIYDQMTNGEHIPDDNDGETYLVDFQQKIVNNIIERRRTEEIHKDSSSPEKHPGISRDEGGTLSSGRSLSDSKELADDPDAPVHYANVLHKEIRTHGVGFYQFSKDEQERQKQMERLTNLRDETIKERSKSQRLKEKRKAQLEARLALVKQRRRMEDGYVEQLEKEKQKSEADVVKEVSQIQDTEKSRPEESHRIPHVREWDEGKEKMSFWNPERYCEEKRKERDPEFAPPSIYDHTTEIKSSTKGRKLKPQCKGKSEETVVSERNVVNIADIPLPPDTQNNTEAEGDISLPVLADSKTLTQECDSHSANSFCSRNEQSSLNSDNPHNFNPNLCDHPSAPYPQNVHEVYPGYTPGFLYGHYPQQFQQYPLPVDTVPNNLQTLVNPGFSCGGVDIIQVSGGGQCDEQPRRGVKIVDTRLVNKEDGLDQIEQHATMANIVNATPYTPGSFSLAAMKAKRPIE